MLNLGGPKNQESVEPFLNNLLSDPEIISLPFQKVSGPVIAKRRALKVKKQYQMIGGGSPILKHTLDQGKLMCETLDSLSPETGPHKSYIAFRYTDPYTSDALQQIKEDNLDRVVVFTQYPQYSCSTTGSSVNELYRELKKFDLDIQKWKLIDRWHSNPYLIKTFVELIDDALKKHFTPEERDEVVLLFCAHSLPLKVVGRGDSYPHEVASTVHKVMEQLGHNMPHKIVWQSKVGPTPWLKPAANDAMLGLGKLGKKNQLIIPITFTSDHIETLYEYDIQYQELAKENDIKLRRTEALNSHPTFITALADEVTRSLSNSHPHHQFNMRCPECTNEYCAESKEYFAPILNIKQ
eukprot:TRINITY_DN2550_c0_g1_i1.p1 TRINITY_DN2550_c0_g1~~TRINITY_DN2550_c0_g1_i1.p1  ORF type:complete len:352 (+),score=67.53 TRINITY_DN2550_c0_g1_i1:131-1186(+)